MRERDRQIEREGEEKPAPANRRVRCRDIKIFLIRVRSGRLPCFFDPRGLFAEPLRPVVPSELGRDVYI